MTTHQFPIPRTGVVPHPRVRSTANPRRLRSWALFVIIVVGAFFGLTYSRTSLDQSAFVLDRIEDEIAAEQVRHSDLRVEVAELRDPRRIAEAAADLGLVYPRQLAVLAVERAAVEEPGPEQRWAQLKSLLSAQPRASQP